MKPLLIIQTSNLYDDLPSLCRSNGEDVTWFRNACGLTLGVCFGHQLIAHTLGGKVGPNPNGAEFGTVNI